jgi:phosphoribosyl-dephospho-CoA transferase
MHALHRNQLVWLSEPAWQQLLRQAWDAQAQALLQHWQCQQLPLVVCRQRTPDAPQRISLGLPAPLQWERRRLALDVGTPDIARSGHFPPLAPEVLGPADAAQLRELLQHMQCLQVPLLVYGSFGWQQLSGLPCVRSGSDLDLLARVPDLNAAGQVVWLLQGLKLACRVDGELLFPNGWAIAWREYAQLIGGRVEQVLVKERGGAQLLDMAALRAQLRAHLRAHARVPEGLQAHPVGSGERHGG